MESISSTHELFGPDVRQQSDRLTQSVPRSALFQCACFDCPLHIVKLTAIQALKDRLCEDERDCTSRFVSEDVVIVYYSMFILISSYGHLPFVLQLSITFLRRGSVISLSLPRIILKICSLFLNKPRSLSLHSYALAIRDQLPITANRQSNSSNTAPDSSREEESHRKPLQNSAKRHTEKL